MRGIDEHVAVQRTRKRGAGIGSRVFAMAEKEGRRRGCTGIDLTTVSIEAPGFHQKQGYDVEATIDCEPLGLERFCMMKRLSPTASRTWPIAATGAAENVGHGLPRDPRPAHEDFPYFAAGRRADQLRRAKPSWRSIALVVNCACERM